MLSAYMQTLYDIAQTDKKVVALSNDNGTDLDKWFIRDMPNQYFELGIAECNAVAVAAGFANNGMIPFIHTNSAFLAYRAFEFIRDDVCYQNNNVKMVGSGCGLSISTLGATHNATEDIGVLRCIPGLRLLSPFNADSTVACIKEAYMHEGPTYVRIGMKDEIGGESIKNGDKFWGYTLIRDGSDIVFFVTGGILKEVQDCAFILEMSNISAQVVYITELKPFDSSILQKFIQGKKLAVTVEEHNIIGGLGTIIAESMIQERINGRLLRIGLADSFSREYGLVHDVRRKNGLDAESIARKIMKECDDYDS